MNVSELAKELNITSKEVLAFLQEKGFAYKSATKKLDDSEIALVKDNLGGKSAAPAKEKKAEKKEAAKPKAEEAKKEEVAEKAPKAEEPKAEAVKADAPAAPKKKKTIIIVGNNIPNRGNAPAGRTPARPAAPTPGAPQRRPATPMPGPGRLIKPTTPPSATPEVHFVPEKQQPSKPAAEHKSEPAKETTPVVENNKPQETKVQTKPATEQAAPAERPAPKSTDRPAERRPEGRTDNNRPPFNRDNNNRQGGRNFNNGPSNAGRPQGNRPGQGGGFNSRPGQAPFKKDEGDGDSRRFMRKPQGGKIFTADAPSVDNRKGDNKRRNNDKDKNKKSGKDFMYEEDGTSKGKSKSKVGAFIKPEKKPQEVEEEIKVITIPEEITIKELAEKMKLQANVIIKELFLKGEMMTLNDVVDFEKAEEIAMEHDILCEAEVKVNVIEELLKEDEENPDTLVSRPPVICVMGHVDHGKTSLLDAIRKTHVIQGEAGGITQHIGAYMVNVTDPETGKDRKITFLDTPGHEAFTAMRMRGANSTDIAILVVAADDGVMPQTKEAINHAKAAGVPIIVAVNKVDKIGYDFNDKSKTMDAYPGIAKLIRELADEHSLIWEEWGGETIFAPISAKQGQGIKELLEMVLLSADMLELKANPNRQARGLVIEAELDKGRGPVATVLVQKGTLHVGDFISAGEAHGKVRAMIDDKGRRIKEASPSTPVEILGLNDVPGAGEIFIAHKSDKEAKNFADTFIAQNKVKKIGDTKHKMSLDDLYSQIQAGNLKELNLIIKADVQGSVEAVRESLEKLSNEEVVVKVIHGGVGAINESDVVLASAAKAIIIGFNVRVDNMARDTVEREGVDVRLYDVIYKAIEDVEAAMKGMLEPVYEEKIIGHAEVRQIFKASAIGNIAGSFVLDGMFERGCLIRITREGEQIYEGKLASLKRFKDDVKEFKAGYECGLVFENFGGMQELDIVEAYKMVEVPRS